MKVVEGRHWESCESRRVCDQVVQAFILGDESRPVVAFEVSVKKFVGHMSDLAGESNVIVQKRPQFDVRIRNKTAHREES